ncbi:MAG: CHAT domain-containing protein [Symploca sp. SIO1B1]|nr:CHAT domain-containing protein [Symploca sp. SIO1B1]
MISSRFDLKIIPIKDHGAVIAESAFGEAAIQIKQDFFSQMIEESKYLRVSYKRLIRYPHLKRDIEPKLQLFGSKLFNGIFQDDILTLFNRTVGGSENSQIDLRLILGSSYLNSIQWEVMRCHNEYLGLRHNIIRQPFVPRPINIPLKTRKQLHILIVAVDPISSRLLPVLEQEHQALVQLIESFGEQVRVSTCWQQEATVERIKEILFEGVDIFHFTGHGFLNIETPLDSSLVVWRDEANSNCGNSSNREHFGQLSIRLLNSLAASHNLGLCFLNTCDLANSVETEILSEIFSNNNGTPNVNINDSEFVNMAHNLNEAGIPAIVATNHAITYRASYRLSKRFYTSLIKYGKRIDQALRDVRVELFVDKHPAVSFSDWSCPVLYARSRHLGLGTEQLEWEAVPDIYSIRNVERLSMVKLEA